MMQVNWIKGNKAKRNLWILPCFYSLKKRRWWGRYLSRETEESKCICWTSLWARQTKSRGLLGIQAHSQGQLGTKHCLSVRQWWTMPLAPHSARAFQDEANIWYRLLRNLDTGGKSATRRLCICNCRNCSQVMKGISLRGSHSSNVRYSPIIQLILRSHCHVIAKITMCDCPWCLGALIFWIQSQRGQELQLVVGEAYWRWLIFSGSLRGRTVSCYLKMGSF